MKMWPYKFLTLSLFRTFTFGFPLLKTSPLRSQNPTPTPETVMLNDIATKAYYALVNFGCYQRLVPYEWDKEQKQLRKASFKNILIYRWHQTFITLINCFTSYRLLEWYMNGKFATNLETFLTFIWSGAYTFTSILMLQFEFLREEIMCFWNSILRQLEASDASDAVYKESKSARKSRKTRSFQVLFAIGIYAVNPLFHTFILPATPCSPNFLSSIYFDCQDPQKVKESITLVQAVPFLLQEYYGVMILSFIWSYNWSMILLGLEWVILELRKMKIMPPKAHETFQRYRWPELIMKEMNRSVYLYLMFFPTLLFFVIAVLLFGAIRLWHLDFRTNVMFPECSVRCTFEGLTPLSLAGEANKISHEVLMNERRYGKDKYARRYIRSCQPVKCAAGGVYTFEHSIVPVSIDNLSQLLFNFLTTFP